MNYTILKSNIYELTCYAIVPLRESDLFDIMQWRNDQIDVLRQKFPLTEQDQMGYYQKVIKPSFSNTETPLILFSFLEHSKCIGYGGLTNIDWESRRAELSFLLDTKRGKDEHLYSQDFTAFLNLIKTVAFRDIEIHRIFAETFDIRSLHIQILEKNGFVCEGRLHDHVLIKGRFVDSLIHGLVGA